MRKTQPSPAQVAAVIAALEDPGHSWRTVFETADASGCPVDVVLAVLYTDPRVVQSDVPSAGGEDLYTTIGHYKKTTPLWRQLLDAVRGRA